VLTGSARAAGCNRVRMSVPRASQVDSQPTRRLPAASSENAAHEFQERVHQVAKTCPAWNPAVGQGFCCDHIESLSPHLFSNRRCLGLSVRRRPTNTPFFANGASPPAPCCAAGQRRRTLFACRHSPGQYDSVGPRHSLSAASRSALTTICMHLLLATRQSPKTLFSSERIAHQFQKWRPAG
jgi:hypothetical protein